MRPFLLLLAVVALHAGEADKLITDQWFVGNINNQPSMTMHAVVLQKADGTFTDRVETNIVLNRVLGGAQIAFEVRDTQVYTVSAVGEITGFTFDHVENGVTTAATGTIAEGKANVSVLRLGRATDAVVEIPAGTKLLGQQSSQELLAKATWKPGDKQQFATLALLGAQVRVVTMTAVHQQTAADGTMTFGMTMDLMPVPTTMTLKPNGDLLGMTMDMGFLKLAFAPSAGPVPLIGAELAPTGLVTAKGPAPASGPTNRYRLPAGAGLPLDEFQQMADDIVTTFSDAQPSVLADPTPYLKAEPQLELDDPQLKAWVDALVARHQVAKPVLAERLRLAVRGYIVKKDLSMGDGSALEAFRSRTGDCSEHANLLAAVLRIAGIPSRVELGMVYAQDYGGWVGHAWNSAYVDDRWVHLDSAYPGIPRSCYLKLGTTSGADGQNTGAAMLGAFGKVLGKDVETLSP
ncbi:MAG: transglutaminase domain-containing protein [Planctomycetes bacterium]|nr:transglutaminase domain-containing protein [Planctomycetota bacterium]